MRYINIVHIRFFSLLSYSVTVLDTLCFTLPTIIKEDFASLEGIQNS